MSRREPLSPIARPSGAFAFAIGLCFSLHSIGLRLRRGKPSLPSAAVVTPCTLPAPPRPLDGSFTCISTTAATVCFALGDAGSVHAVPRFVCQIGRDGGFDDSDRRAVEAEPCAEGMRCTLAGLPSAVPLLVRFAAETEIGCSVWSEACGPFVLAPARPQPCSALVAVDVTPSTAVLEWTAPLSDGDAPMQYCLLQRVERGGGNGGEWEPCSMAETCAEFGAAPLRPGVRVCVTVGGLAPGCAYSFSLSARNAIGESGGRTLSLTTACRPPAAPCVVCCEAIDRGLAVSWQWPEDEGGSVTTAAQIAHRTDGGRETLSAELLVDRVGMPRTLVRELRPCESYQVRMRLANRLGWGAWSAWSDAVCTAASAPWPPTDVQCDVSPSRAQLRFAPACTGGVALTALDVEVALGLAAAAQWLRVPPDDAAWVLLGGGVAETGADSAATHASAVGSAVRWIVLEPPSGNAPVVTRISIEPLLPALWVRFRLRVHNAVGWSEWSAPTPACCTRKRPHAHALSHSSMRSNALARTCAPTQIHMYALTNAHARAHTDTSTFVRLLTALHSAWRALTCEGTCYIISGLLGCSYHSTIGAHACPLATRSKRLCGAPELGEARG